MHDTWALAIHGDAGTIRRDELTSAEEAAMSLEDCPRFNAGHGSTFTAAGGIEMDAALMTTAAQAGAVRSRPSSGLRGNHWRKLPPKWR